jgi:hypothetical protein
MKKPYLINLIFTGIIFIACSISLFIDTKNLIAVLLIAIQFALLYFQKYKIIKIYYVFQLALIAIGLAGMIYLNRDFDPVTIISIGLIVASVVGATSVSYLTVNHQSEQIGTLNESQLLSKIKIGFFSCLSVFVIGILLISNHEKFTNSTQADTAFEFKTPNSYVEYYVYNCSEQTNGKESVVAMQINKLRIFQDSISLNVTITNPNYTGWENYEKCLVDKKTKFSSCKFNNNVGNNNKIGSSEILFDGQESLSLKAVYEIENSVMSSLLKCSVKK